MITITGSPVFWPQQNAWVSWSPSNSAAPFWGERYNSHRGQRLQGGCICCRFVDVLSSFLILQMVTPVSHSVGNCVKRVVRNMPTIPQFFGAFVRMQYSFDSTDAFVDLPPTAASLDFSTAMSTHSIDERILFWILQSWCGPATWDAVSCTETGKVYTQKGCIRSSCCLTFLAYSCVLLHLYPII